MSENPFEQYAGQGHLRRADKQLGTKKLTGADAAQATNDQLTRRYKAAKKKQREDALALEGGENVKELLKILQTIDDPDNYLRMTAQNAAWLKRLPTELKWVFLQSVDRQCQKRREDVGLPPLDDDLSSLWGEPQIGVYEIVKQQIGLWGK